MKPEPDLKFKALMKLLDDEDPQVFAAVEKELLHGGDETARMLELEMDSADAGTRKRIENLVSRIHLDKLQREYDRLLDFVSGSDFTLERALFLLAKPLH